MQQRTIHFETYQDAIDEIERLEQSGYERLGQWSLGKICHHLNYYHNGFLHGFGFKLPWLLRYFIGKPTLRKWFKEGRMQREGRTVPDSVPHEEIDEQGAIDECKRMLKQLETATDLHPSPLFGQMSLEDAKRLNLIHAAHHLGLLIPKTANNIEP